jgi:hypothetical protein
MRATQLEANCVGFDRSSTSRAPRSWQWCLSVTVSLTLLSLCGRVTAQAAQVDDDGLPKALLCTTSVQRGKSVPELDKQIHKAIVEHAPVHLVAGPPKKLSSLQAGARCHDESVACLRTVARAAGVEVLLAATLERGAGELTLTFMAFDARADAVTRVAHWQDGSDVTAETYAALPNLLSALFPEPGPPDMDFVAEANNASSEAAAAPGVTASASTDTASERSLLAPLLVASAGALLIGAGVGTGLMLNATQSDYEKVDVTTRADAESADSLRARAGTQATLANVFYGLGSVALVASGAWLTWELMRGDKQQERTTLSPWLTPRQVGFVLTHQGGSF